MFYFANRGRPCRSTGKTKEQNPGHHSRRGALQMQDNISWVYHSPGQESQNEVRQAQAQKAHHGRQPHSDYEKTVFALTPDFGGIKQRGFSIQGIPRSCTEKELRGRRLPSPTTRASSGTEGAGKKTHPDRRKKLRSHRNRTLGKDFPQRDE